MKAQALQEDGTPVEVEGKGFKFSVDGQEVVILVHSWGVEPVWHVSEVKSGRRFPDTEIPTTYTQAQAVDYAKAHITQLIKRIGTKAFLEGINKEYACPTKSN